MQPLDSPPARADHIVPFTMKRLGGNADPLHFFVRHSSPRRILAPVEATGHGQPLRGGRARDQAHDRLVVPQRLTTPIRGDEREQAVLHLVPLAGARWEVADLEGQGGGIGELLQLELPHAQAIAVAAPAIRRDQQAPRPRVQPVAFEPPPAPDRGHRKGARVVVGAHVHEPFVAGQIIHAVGIGPRHRGSRKIVALHEGRPLASAPLPALVLVIPDQLLLLRVHGDDRSAPGQRPADLIIDVLELRVAVGMIRAFLGLPVPLEAVVHRAQKLRHLLMADRMVLAREFRRERPRALARPAQRGLRVAARQWLHQGFQRSRQLGVAHQERVAPPAGPPDSSGRDRVLPQFTDPLGDGDPGQSADVADPRDASIALVHGLVRGHHSPAALIQVSPDACELPFESVMSFDAPTVACSGLICRCYLLTRANGAGYAVSASRCHSGGRLWVARMWINSPSDRATEEKYPSHSRTALRAMTSNTGWTSVGELLITRRISAVAVCCSRDSVRSRLRASSSLNRRAFSTAMTAWSAKVFSSSISLSENGPGSARVTAMAPMGAPSRSIGTERMLRAPIARDRVRCW